MESEENLYEIHGLVTGREGHPLDDARVTAWWQHIRGRRELAAGNTSDDGRYHVRYRIPDDAAEPVLVVVEAVSDRLDAPLSSPQTQAAPHLEIDLHYEPKDQSEWATLVRSIEPFLEGLALSDLVENHAHQDITFLAREIGKDGETVMRVAVSARLAAAFRIPAPAFYAFVRQHVPAGLPSPLLDASQDFTLIDPLIQRIGSLIFALSADTQKSTLTSAIALDLIGQQYTNAVSRWVDQLQALRTTDLLSQPYLLGKTTLGQLLEVVALPEAKQQAFAQALAGSTISMRNFWRTLGDGGHGLTAEDASAIERTLSVGAFVKNFVPLTQALVQGFDAGTYTSLADLAKLTMPDWVRLVNENGTPPGIEAAGTASPAEVFAAVIYNRVTRAYPTAALSSRIAAGTFVPPPQRQPLAQFFQNNAALELMKDSIPAYLAAHEDALAGIAAADQQAVIAHARSFQRVLRAAPNVDVAENLLGQGINSAVQIAALGQQQFFVKATEAGLTKREADHVFRVASQRYAQLVSLYLRFNTDTVGISPKAMGQLSDLNELAQQAIQRDQSLATLFGSQDYCATDDCTSILSPAAYLCDLLLWLRHRQQVGRTALDVLDSRRPDIRHLLLDCPNTDSELPYIDLVNELLADTISPPVDALATSFVQAALANGTTYFYIVTAVNAMGESAASAQVSATPAAPSAAPAAPAGLTAVAGDGQVTIGWTAVPGAASYNIYWSTTAGVTTANGTEIAGASNPDIETGLVNGTTYFYIVTAVNAMGESAASAQVSATPAAPSAAPAAPAGLTAVAGDGQVTIGWTAVPGAASYNIYWSTTAGVTTANGTEIAGASNPDIETGLVNGTTYFYIVTAVNAMGESAASAQVSATPAAPSAAPAAPAGLTAVAGDGQVTIGWTAVPGAASYNIYWSTTAGVTTANGTEIAGARNPTWKQTSANKTAAELAAAPEYFNQGAFNALSVANYPFSLPYSAGLDGLRTYLQQRKLPLWQLRQALIPLGGGTLAQNVAVAAERFTVPPHGAELITTGPADPGYVPPPEAWNIPDPATDLVPVDAFTQAASISYEQLLELLDVSWVQGEADIVLMGVNDQCMTSQESLAPAPLDAGFLDRAHRFLRLWGSTGYKMWELDLLLESAGVAAGTLDAAGLVALYAFKQLQDQTGLAADRQLAFYQDIDTGTHRDTDGTKTVSLYSQIFLNPAVTSVAPDPDLVVLPSGGTVADPNLTDHLPAIQAALGVSADDVNTLFGLTDNGLTLDNLSLIYRVTELAAAAQLTIPDLIALAQLLHPGAAPAALAPLSASPSATLAFLAQASDLRQPSLSMDAVTYLLTPPIATTLALPMIATDVTVTVTGDAGFPSPDFYVTIGSEILQVTAVGGAGNTTWTVSRGQQGTTPAGAGAGTSVGLADGWVTTTQMTTADITTALGAVQQAVQNLPTTLTSPITVGQTSITVAGIAQFPPPNFYVSIGSEILLVTGVAGAGKTDWTVVRGQQGTTAAAAPAGTMVAPVSASTTLAAPLAATATSLTVASDAGFPPAKFYISVGSEILLVNAVGGAGSTTWTVLRGQQGTTAAAAPAGATVTPTGANLNGSIIAAVASNAHTARNSGLANDVTALVLNALQVPGTGLTLLAVLADPAFIGSATPVTPENFPAQYLAIQFVDKAGVMVRALRLVAADLGWLIANAAAYGGLDFTSLPVTPGQPTLSLPSLLTTLLLIKLTRLWKAAPPQSAVQTLYDVLAEVSSGALGSEAATQAAIATITGWPLSDVAAFAQALGLVFPADYTRPRSYDALRKLTAMVAQSSATGGQLVAWGAVPPDEPTAQGQAAGALSVLKAQQPSNAVWLAVAPAVMNPLRDRRAAALQAYLTGQRDSAGNIVYGDANGLFDYFLIDTQMTSCQVTSRVVQAYIAVQIFVERCLMNLEAPAVVVDLTRDDAWNQWEWMKRYRIWEANREVFLYPENWLIESQRPNRSEIYQKLEQEIHQGQSTTDYLETVALNYIDRLDALAHLQVTGTCEDPASGDIYVVARTLADPPVFYYRSYSAGAWTGWVQVPLDIKAHQAVPTLYRGRLCLFWTEVKISNEPNQVIPAPQASSTPPPQSSDKYVALTVFFSIFRNGSWAPAQAAKGKLFDKPFYNPNLAGDPRTVEALYTLKVQAPAPAPGYGARLFVDVFRLGYFQSGGIFNLSLITSENDSLAVHLGRAVFDGRFSDLELRNMQVPAGSLVQPRGQPQQQLPAGIDLAVPLLSHAQAAYGPDAQPLLPLPDNQADPNLVKDSGLLPQAGALASAPADPAQGAAQTLQLNFTSASALEQNAGPLLMTAQVPLRVVGPVTDLAFDPASYFFFQDNRRCYWVESQKFFWTGSAWSPVVPSDPASAPYQVRYSFHVFYHPFTRLFWNQLAGGGFDLFYDPALQQTPDQIDPTGADAFSFNANYAPTWRVTWDHDDRTGADRQFLDFSRGASFSVYNWELFYHIPVYIAQMLSQNQQFEQAQAWFHYVFNPTRQGSDPVPQRFWIPKPLHNLTGPQILGEQVNLLLEAVNNGDPAALLQVQEWQANPFNPFLLADLRLGVPYMKYTVMSYLDNLIAWGDNLFASQSREALSEATLLYVTASEILGPAPVAVTPPQHADESFDQLEPKLDAFANAMVEIENLIGHDGGAGSGTGTGGIPLATTFYFKIPPNDKLLGYWRTVSDRLYKMRHCQTIAGAPLQLALFDAPIDPGLLIAAQAAGVDLSSVLSSIFVPLPNYRFTALYSVALDFVNAVRSYGSALQSALEKSDSAALSLLQQTTQQQLLADGSQIFEWQVEQAQNNINATQEAYNLAQQRYTFNSTQSFKNAGETVDSTIATVILANDAIVAIMEGISSIAHLVPQFMLGAAGFGGSPQAGGQTGGTSAGHSTSHAAEVGKAVVTALEKGATLARTQAGYQRRADNWAEAAAEATIQMSQATAQLASLQLATQIAQLNQQNHQEQIDNLQKQIDFANTKFTSQDLYDWTAGLLAATYFQSYQLAYQMCKQVERCYQFELGIQDSSFVQFGYWDSLHKGLLAGETLNHDLRRMEASYLQENSRRYELSRYVSLGLLDPGAFQQLLISGACDFVIPESLFDNDYPGHYNRRLTRVSVTVVYPNPGKFDNVKGTLTLTANRVRISTDTAAGYAESPVGSDPRFAYDYAAIPQKIALGNAQDDPGLFVNSISSNITDQRYLPFENAGAASSWHFEMPEATNEIDLSTVGDVVLHLYYTALDGGGAFQHAVQDNNAANVPTSGVRIFSAQNDFQSAWQAFLAPANAPASQVLTVSISPVKFPAWTRGKTISVTSLTVLTISWPAAVSFVLVPQAPLPAAAVTLNPVPHATEPNVCSGSITTPANTSPGRWSFELQKQGAADFRSLTGNDIGDVLLLVGFSVS